MSTAVSSVYSSIIKYIQSLTSGNKVIKDFSSKNIKEVIENYQQIQSRFKTNQIIFEFYEDKKINTALLINKLKRENIKTNDPYITVWVKDLEELHAKYLEKIEELKEHQNVFKNFTDQFSFVSNSISEDEERDLCNICEDRKRDRSLDCGHIYCETCINMLDNCPICRLSIDRTKIRPVYL